MHRRRQSCVLEAPTLLVREGGKHVDCAQRLLCRLRRDLELAESGGSRAGGSRVGGSKPATLAARLAAPRRGSRAALRGPSGSSYALRPRGVPCSSARAPRAVGGRLCRCQDAEFDPAAVLAGAQCGTARLGGGIYGDSVQQAGHVVQIRQRLDADAPLPRVACCGGEHQAARTRTEVAKGAAAQIGQAVDCAVEGLVEAIEVELTVRELRPVLLRYLPRVVQMRGEREAVLLVLVEHASEPGAIRRDTQRAAIRRDRDASSAGGRDGRP